MITAFESYRQRLVRSLPLLLIISFAAAAIAYLLSVYVGPSYEERFSYLVSLSNREATPEFRFDGFYALQATDLFAQTLAKWLTTPEVVVAAYTKAGVTLPSQDPRSLVRTIAAEKIAPQLVAVTVKGATASDVERLGEGLRIVMAENIALYHDEGIPAVAFRVVTTEPWRGVRHVAVPVIVIAVFVVTLFLGINVVLLYESLRQE